MTQTCLPRVHSEVAWLAKLRLGDCGEVEDALRGGMECAEMQAEEVVVAPCYCGRLAGQGETAIRRMPRCITEH